MMAGADEPATLSGLCQPMAIAMVRLSDGQSRIGVRRRRYVGRVVVSSSMVNCAVETIPNDQVSGTKRSRLLLLLSPVGNEQKSGEFGRRSKKAGETLEIAGSGSEILR